MLFAKTFRDVERVWDQTFVDADTRLVRAARTMAGLRGERARGRRAVAGDEDDCVFVEESNWKAHWRAPRGNSFYKRSSPPREAALGAVKGSAALSVDPRTFVTNTFVEIVYERLCVITTLTPLTPLDSPDSPHSLALSRSSA